MKSFSLLGAQLLWMGRGLSNSGPCNTLAWSAYGGGAQQFIAGRRGPAEFCTLFESQLFYYVQHMRIPRWSINPTNQKQGLTPLAIPLVYLQHASVINSPKASQRAGYIA